MSISNSQPCVLLVNLGTPDSPTPQAVRRFLGRFLSDRRVVETHPAIWQPILRGIILRTRPKKSAKKYAAIWEDSGSPLLRFTRDQSEYLEAELAQNAAVRFAMRYGPHTIKATLDSLYSKGFRKLLVIPLYPQYSASTVASVTDEVYRWNLAVHDQFDLRVLRSFPSNSGYIEALVQAIQNRWADRGLPDFAGGDRLVLSYHGIPVAMQNAGDPYPDECRLTTSLVQQRLGLADRDIVHAYQSVFGPAEWLKPATIETVEQLGRQGANHVDVICPGFTSDCLETLEEIDIQNREVFLSAGGSEFNYIPWANSSPVWLEALRRITKDNLVGWI